MEEEIHGADIGGIEREAQATVGAEGEGSETGAEDEGPATGI